jgi:hypothetical protein
MSKTWLIESQDGKVAMTEFQRADFHDYSKNHPKAKYRLSVIETVRTLPQNRLYWIFLEKIARETGDDAESLHQWAKRQFLKPKFIKVRGTEMKIPGSTRELSKLEFGEYMDKISATTEIAIPDPVETGYIK